MKLKSLSMGNEPAHTHADWALCKDRSLDQKMTKAANVTAANYEGKTVILLSMN